jgi:hypothetical protein
MLFTDRELAVEKDCISVTTPADVTLYTAGGESGYDRKHIVSDGHTGRSGMPNLLNELKELAVVPPVFPALNIVR